VSDLNSSGEVEPVADAGRAERDLAVGAARQRDQLLHRAHRQAGIDSQNIGFGDREIAHGLEVANYIERQLFVEARIDHERARRHQERVAVRRRFRHRLRAENAVRAGPVLDHEGLSGLSGKLLANDAADHIGRAAGGKGHDHPHRLTGILRRRGRDRAQDSQRSGQGDDVSPLQPPAQTRPSLHVGTRVNPP